MATWNNDANRALTDEWQQLFRGRKTGDVVDFAGGKMTINVAGDPTMESSYSGNWISPDGQSLTLNRIGQGRDARANANPAIADYYNKQYGFLSNTARLNSNLAAGTATDTVGNLINTPQVAGIYNPLTGQTSGTGAGYVDPLYKISPNTPAGTSPTTGQTQPTFGGNNGQLPPGLSGRYTGGGGQFGFGGSGQLSGSPGGPSIGSPTGSGNPYLSQMGDLITQRVSDNLNTNIMPGIRSNAIAAGGFGGSRQGVVEANAIKGANQSAADALTGMYFGDYTNQQNRDLQRYGMDQSYGLGMTNANNSFYNANRGMDLQQLQLGANLLNMGNQGYLGQGSGLYGLGQTQQQAPWNVINNANAGLGQWSGYGTTTSANQGGGAQGMFGGALAGGQLGNLWGNTGSSTRPTTGMTPSIESYYGY